MAALTRFDELVEKLRERDCRITPQRVAVLRVLTEEGTHLTADQIYDRIRRELPTTSLATVYKTVSLLKDVGALQELSLAGDSSYYDAGQDVPHPHLVCTHCGEVRDVEMGEMEGVLARVRRETGYQITEPQFNLFGICPRCQQTHS